MKRRATVAALGLSMFVLTTAPVAGQLWFFPDYAVPSVDGTSSTFVAGSYGRGLNDNSGKADAVSGFVGRTSSSVSFVGGFGYIDLGPLVDSEWTIGGAAGYDLLSDASPAQVTLQAGIGWMQPGVADVTMLRFPIGVALKGKIASSSATVTPWVMPRLNIVRASSNGLSDTQTDLGASGGVAVTMPSGLGVHAALDLLALDGAEQLMVGVGAHYVLGR